MKTQFRFGLLTVFVLAGTMAVAGMQQDPTEEVPGDNFSLEGALELFKKSASPKEFEQLLNSADQKVNNLDLNGDGDIDYIRVVDRAEGNIHTFTLQALVSSAEAQDIAVIELEKRDDGTAVLQIVGDADIYGIETIIEPTSEVRVNAGTTTARTVVNVWPWPVVQYVYGPAYSLWVSPWYWSYYPGWWRPWRPIAWYVYDPYWAPYRPYYSFCYSHRVFYAHRLYRPYRTTSVIVYNRHYNQVHQYRTSRSDSYNSRGYYRGDRSRSSDSYSRNSYRSRSDNSRYSDNSRTRSDVRDRSSRYAPPTNDMSRESASRRQREFSTETRTNDVNDFKMNRSNSGSGGTRQRSYSTPSDNSNTRQQRSYSTPSDNSNTRQQRSYSAPSDNTPRQQRSYSTPGNDAPRQRSFSTPSDNGGGRQRSFTPSSGGSSGQSRSYTPSRSSGGGQRSVSPSSGGGGGRSGAPSNSGSGGGGRSRSRN